MAMSSAKALSRLASVTMSRGLRFPFQQVEDLLSPPPSPTPLDGGPLRGWCHCREGPSRWPPGRQFMEFAVNIPEQEPQVGARGGLDGEEFRLGHLAALHFAHASKTVMRSLGLPSGVCPFNIGPPVTKMVGILMRTAAMIMPGVILSQLEMQIRASEAVGHGHGFHGVRDEFAAGQGIAHAQVPHGNAVVHGDGVELEGNPACFPHGHLHRRCELVQVRVPRLRHRYRSWRCR